jgi:peptidoglycan/LPS O-acetylase OafA/YrhL
LRALAVGLVLVYHAFPTLIPGGFIGVDVFFVISGFLITLLLLRELDTTGHIKLLSFYARRVRRLMPAALVVTAFTVIASMFLVGPVRLIAIVEDAMWSTANIANVRFGMSPDSYFMQGEKSPLLHFWSLGVEEQFYFIWPLLLIALAATLRARWERAVPVVLGVIMLVSLTASVTLTDAGWGHAYFSLATRAWELALGGLIAVAVFSGVRLPMRHGAVVVGLLAVLWAAFAYSETTAFPGLAATVPTLGAALLIWAGASGDARYERAIAWRPIQFLGDISYSLYLWHWPLLLLGGYALGTAWPQRLAVVTVAVALAAVSYYLVEKKVGEFRPWWSSIRVIAIGATTTVATLAVGGLLIMATPVSGGTSTAAAEQTAASSSTVGWRIVPRSPDVTAPQAVPANLQPALPELAGDLADVFTNGCFGAELVVCEGGDPGGDVRVVLAGDSHAGHWWPAADAAARENGWQLFMVGKNGCPLSFVKISSADTAEPWPECAVWQRAAVDAVVELDADVIVYANHVNGYSAKLSVRDNFTAAWAAGTKQVLTRLVESATVVALGQQPTLAVDPGTCLSENLGDVSACDTPRANAVSTSVSAEIERLAKNSGAYYVDVADFLCDENCPLIDRNLVMYRDPGHFSQTYAKYLAPVFAAIVVAALDAR